MVDWLWKVATRYEAQDQSTTAVLSCALVRPSVIVTLADSKGGGSKRVVETMAEGSLAVTLERLSDLKHIFFLVCWGPVLGRNTG